MTADRERGSATVWTVALAGVLVAVGLAAVLVGAAVVARHRAGAAADLAALAGAARAVAGDPAACDTAGEVARANGAALTACTVADGAVVAVTVEVAVRLGPLASRTAQGRARAGPVAP
ncbi:helicase/secretion neighborhood TadE-like protein [Geodermatophilus telluris]|uniref:Helicase/secretion neighborhood TadE-like protein n=1 Tax=Geodermatophilus telluris TaxID=1190417 RepID=A0A1G6LK24_9ACTN|nr:Rv3654c family TadE-like protein [Geodermatophilus telluris]SDC43347.1 helicase/secretion neighborhood TadE-like protein [Geodermatophilus telluris]